MDKKIIGFHVDDQGDWVADLECGHAQHVRHNPPWINRPWVLEQEGRDKSLGETLDCLKCNMPLLPTNSQLTRVSELFDQQVLIDQYAGSQTNNTDCWVQVVVSEGALVYRQVSEETKGYVIDQGFFAVIEPGATFLLSPMGAVLFHFCYYQYSS
ncbi:DUF3565 domain-containing protein [Alkalimarinus alittae]|uniref:DUF3565 domain-containing protein n=1 Tax=Alkalimarinus alittae TaxID=2961619 RepID=UPI0038778F24